MDLNTDSLKAGAAYWGLIFALGFVLGTIRTVWGAAALGETTFILFEVPVMLIASWLAARWLTSRYAIACDTPALVMGGFAFTLLMASELALTAALGADPLHWLAGLARPPGLYGFVGQIAFALMPWLVTRRP